MYELYVESYFTYLEINPLVVTNDSIYILDLAAKLDSTADFICGPKWGNIDYPPPFGRDAFPEEAYIADLDAKSGASLKLTILNRNGRIWTMVAGGGASVIYSDTICDLGGSEELANYGEYSGAPSEQQTYEYAKTILNLMTSSPKHPLGKVLITGGGIANFTNVAATFRGSFSNWFETRQVNLSIFVLCHPGIITALREFQPKLVDHNISIFVRRAGPNYQEGLRKMREIGSTLGIPLFVFGPETHMTAICGMALGKRPIPQSCNVDFATANFLLPGGQQQQEATKTAGGTNGATTGKRSSIFSSLCVLFHSIYILSYQLFNQLLSKMSPYPFVFVSSSIISFAAISGSDLSQTEIKLPPISAGLIRQHKQTSVKTGEYQQMFGNRTKAIVWGMQTRAVQSMLDFDFICR